MPELPDGTAPAAGTRQPNSIQLFHGAAALGGRTPTGSLLGLARRCRENAHLQPLLTVEQPIQFVEVNEGDATAGKMQVVAQVQEYVKNHLSEKLTLADVAAVFNFSPNYLSQLFGKYGDSGFVEYITETRDVYKRQALHGVVVCKVPDKFSHKPREMCIRDRP